MNGYYRADVVTVNDVLFESLSTAIAYITDNYEEWCGLGRFTDTTLVSVDYEDGAVWVEYTLDDEDFADDNVRRESYNVDSLDMLTAV